MNWARVQPCIDLSVRQLCCNPYPLHKHGCPNYGEKHGCPPTALFLPQLLDLEFPVWVIWNVFDFKGYCRKMKHRHPSWSKRQVRNCLYWQPTERKRLRETIVKEYLTIHPKHTIVWCPEACGVNVTETMRRIGHHLEWPPKMKVYQVVLAGVAK
ncbi:MAG: hypothetical protein KAS32_10160 [Candidatus Peribacteraceae bacterium]|nr:hypothetical protein [Candidatus Peribacteraceae bacterium]